MRTSYEERIADIKENARRLGRRATVAKLYDELRTEDRCGTPRRIGATCRWDKRQRHPVFVREGKERIALRESL